MRKNILWVNHFLPYPPRGGLLIRTNALITEVAKHHNVTLVSLVQPRLITPYFDSVEDGIEEVRQWCEKQNITLHTFDMPSEKSYTSRYLTAFTSLFSSKPYSVNWLASSEMKNFLLNELDITQFDVVHVDTMGLLENLEGVYLPESVIINHHNAEHIMMKRRAVKESNPLKRIYYALEAKKIYLYDARKALEFKQHIACSRPDADEIEKLGQEVKATLIPNGVAVKSQVERSPIRGCFLFVGGLDWYPNTDAIIFLLEHVAPKLSDKKLKIQIDIVGKNPSSKIIELASRFEFVKLHGYVDDINAMYANAQAFICPLRDGGGTKLKVLDAMMHGLPVIGTDIAFEGIDVVDGKHGFVCNHPEELVSLILEMSECHDHYKYEHVGQNARDLVQRQYDASAIAKNYSQQLNQL